MNWQQFLTEKVLGERWHEWIKCPEVGLQAKCSCGMLYDVTSYNRADILYIHRNRTFDNRNDLMDLYEQIEKDGKLISFLNYLNAACDWKDFDPIRDRALEYLFKWLFCLDGSGYEEKCKMVAEFYGWEEVDHD